MHPDFYSTWRNHIPLAPPFLYVFFFYLLKKVDANWVFTVLVFCAAIIENHKFSDNSHLFSYSTVIQNSSKNRLHLLATSVLYCSGVSERDCTSLHRFLVEFSSLWLSAKDYPYLLQDSNAPWIVIQFLSSLQISM